MIPSIHYVRAYRKNCPNVRFSQDEAAELHRMFQLARDDGRSVPEGTLFAIVRELNQAGVIDYEGRQIGKHNVLQGVRRLLEGSGK